MNKVTILAGVMVLAVAVTACGPAASTTSQSSPASDAASPPASAATPGAASSTAAAAPEAELAAWQTVALRDVRSGESFAIADLAGSLVVVEPMAVWCGNCLRQQKEVAKALRAVARDEVVYISLGIDPSEAERDLAAYADDNGFDWRFAVAPRELSRALAEAFGDRVLAPPSTPRIVVTPDGQVIGPAFGIADAGTVEAELREHLS
jgi:cytochrome oxidase Cu insertion factor (SCO1/SenC/PrrC family)